MPQAQDSWLVAIPCAAGSTALHLCCNDGDSAPAQCESWQSQGAEDGWLPGNTG